MLQGIMFGGPPCTIFFLLCALAAATAADVMSGRFEVQMLRGLEALAGQALARGVKGVNGN